MSVKLPREMIDFFFEIRLNNNIAFFEANRQRFKDVVQQPLLDFAQALLPTISAIDPALDTRPTRVLSRIRRDTRFTKDKSPYRDRMWMAWDLGGEERHYDLAYYWQITAEAIHWGCGMYADNKAVMDKLRQRMVDKPAQVLKVLNGLKLGNRFLLKGDAYKRLAVPEGLNPLLAELYIKKGFYLESIPQGDEFDLAFGGGLEERVAADFQLIAPLYNLVKGL